MRLLGGEVRNAIGNNSVRVIVITGAGDRTFSAGGDMGEMAHFTALQTDTLSGIQDGIADRALHALKIGNA